PEAGTGQRDGSLGDLFIPSGAPGTGRCRRAGHGWTDLGSDPLWPLLSSLSRPRHPQDNFGYDLPAVEAAMKKHEAIEADVSSYEERIQGVAELALALEAEGYYDVRRISAQKGSILRQWGLLTELVGARRARLEQSLALQTIFQEMVYMIDWMEEMQAPLLSREVGKHLLEVEDLLQKHTLLEADVAAQSERVQALNQAALKFCELEGRCGPGPGPNDSRCPDLTPEPSAAPGAG
ncbi:spectrin beta chain, non-erythrocytic 4-like, partial [Chelydra serpentina]